MSEITLQNVSLEYPIFDVTSRSVKVSLFNQVVGSTIQKSRRLVRIKGLDNLSVTLNKGDRVGLIGHNGSGKSTLLRVLAGVTYPQLGTVTIRGRIVPLIERGLGVNPEMSGRENIALPMLLLGATEEEVRHAQEEIPDWSGLGEYIDLPTRTYSDGMKSRLMFAISTAIRGDILLLDEWMGAGDAPFIKKASERLDNMLREAGIMVVATHAESIMRQFCNRVMWLDKGALVAIGPTEEVLERYRNNDRPSDPYLESQPVGNVMKVVASQ